MVMLFLIFLMINIISIANRVDVVLDENVDVVLHDYDVRDDDDVASILKLLI